jgi:methanogenic corrinoid protein MtbC1
MDDLEQTTGFEDNIQAITFVTAIPFVAPEIAARADVAIRQSRLADVIAHEIVPRLMLIHHEVLPSIDANASPPSQDAIAELASLVLGPDIHAAANYISGIKQRGISLDVLFVELLEPAARYLGEMWENDRCDFIDVTLGVGRLQQLLAIFNQTHDLPALGDRRRVLMTATAGEQHRFGLAMVEKFLQAAGWNVTSEPGATAEALASLVQNEWFAVAGLTLSRESKLDQLAAVIKAIRQYSCNPSIGVMVGGPAFADHPEFAIRVGADAAAVNAPTAVLLAQKLFDLGAARRAIPSAKA